MTKEEIQKNSEHWYNKYKDAEKRIEELEKKVGRYQTGMFDEIEKRDKKLTKAKELLKAICDGYESTLVSENEMFERIQKAEQFLNGEGCPDCFCEDCTKEDCGIKELGLVEVEK